jgi:hypothetical protein
MIAHLRRHLDCCSRVPRDCRYHCWSNPRYIIGDCLGRRWSLIQDATMMFVELLMLTTCGELVRMAESSATSALSSSNGVGVGGK